MLECIVTAIVTIVAMSLIFGSIDAYRLSKGKRSLLDMGDDNEWR